MKAIGIEPENILLEPSGRNTAPAVAIAALTIVKKDPEGVLLVMPADHVISNQMALQEAILVAQNFADIGHLVTFGVQPRAPETGYGYIQAGPSLCEGKAFAVSRFVEKPDAATARRYVNAGDYYWNSGIFAFQARAYLAELARLEPEILSHCQIALNNGKTEAGGFRLEQAAFEACKSISIDYAVMEHTDKAAIVPVELGWSDIGSWAALWDTSAKDPEGNVVVGEVLHHNTRNSYLRSDGPLIAALGAEDLVVVASADAVLVAPKSAAQDVKVIIEQLERRQSDLQLVHLKIHHPWGWSERLNQDKSVQVNRISLNPGARLTLRGHDKSIGHLIVISGTAHISSTDHAFQLKENESCALSGTGHRLENMGDAPLCIIEIRL